jgi:ABC-type glycerol-3-phosphate transport system substrate-binding protein
MPKKANSIVLIILIISMLCGCTTTSIKNDTQEKEPVKLIYYTIGTPDNDLEKVQDALNNILRKKINVELEYIKINWEDYESRMNAIINTSSDYDIIFTYDKQYVEYAKKGAFLSLNRYLDSTATGLYQAVDGRLWNAVTVNQNIYGVPTNKELATPEWWIYCQELVEKYNIDITKYNSLESLEPLFKMIAELEPDYTVMQLDSKVHNFFALSGWEYVMDSSVPLMVQSQDQQLQVVDIFETEMAESVLQTLRQYYLAGYINMDAALKESSEFKAGEKVFWNMASGGPCSEVTWSNNRNYKVVAHQVGNAVITNESSQGAIMAVNAFSKHPEAAVAFLNLLNTDAEVRNLINYGIEGVHYTRDDDNRIVIAKNSGYSGVQYTQGNWFILDLTADDPIDKWEQYNDFNSKAVKSNLLGFTYDSSLFSEELEAIRKVNDKYYAGLMTGTLDTEIFLPKFIEELKEAGIDRLRDELQSQIDKWLAGE